MLPLAEIVVSACLVVSIFLFGLVIDMEAQRRMSEVKAQHMVNPNASKLTQWPATLIKPEPVRPCTTDDSSASSYFLSTVKTTALTSPGSLYFRSICETGSDAPSLTLKAKSISCRMWQHLETYLDRQFAPPPSKPTSACRDPQRQTHDDDDEVRLPYSLH
ncbi:hypothetical protein H257_13488 [Aphanomyces astaci]|uniref:Uncharacterized protein n=1 Tax=Aphanomyces astaci TaxID=112090 RepID=W4FUC3_APHAT|nr:hypothetical protein H257_13488 [Aphanomyces astaci]ETV71080.1 hypothetical protein H257_13488 [Aphanomyces astaci]RHY94441.1 hypothetical protein DYB35_009255 [Aphanomyces astaci]RHZ09506.1 hypothetical protein DYB37_013589 [Aphanomyces astaci]RQM25892.1 hypothetical protein B5M09_001814 [Aphanomyces astaci]|eukprot:XP_009839326.1 hypothetical protein H257_13488 [Aphanomyces astaci]